MEVYCSQTEVQQGTFLNWNTETIVRLTPSSQTEQDSSTYENLCGTDFFFFFSVSI